MGNIGAFFGGYILSNHQFYPMAIFTKDKQIQWNESIIYFGIILFIIASPIVFQPNDTLNWEWVKHRWMILLPFIILALVNHYILLPKLFFKNQKKIYLLIMLLSICTLTYLKTAVIQSQRPDRPYSKMKKIRPLPDEPFKRENSRRNEGRERPMGKRPIRPELEIFLAALAVVLLDTGFRSTFRLMKTEHYNVKLEKDNFKNRLSVLQHQISPHFFMNTLNNVHALISFDPDGAQEAIIKLSKLMRNILQTPESGEVPLSSEINFLNNYIDLMSLRFNDKLNLKTQFPSIIPSINIPPLLFTSIIENAFKYGVSYQNDSFIEITMNITDHHLIFQIKNSIQGEKEKSTGIGLQNTKDRLDLLYKSNYTLNINQENNIFDVELILPI